MTVVSQVWRASTGTARGQLPSRYDEWWHPEYFARVEACFRPGISILDIGAGRSPTIPPGDRPIGCRYVGLDLSQAELEKAPAGGYDQTIAADATRRIPSIEASFDLVLSYLVLEHVADLPKALDNIRSYLVPNGRFLAFFSGAFSAFGLANRVLPSAVSTIVLDRLLHREYDSVFPAFYHQCWASAIDRNMQTWSKVEIKPMWYGAGYFTFSRLLQAVYIGYEEWAKLRNFVNISPYYLVDATR